MIEFIKITLAYFRPFTEAQAFYFPLNKPGLYSLIGINEVEPQLSPNASGKSSILDGLAWTLFGKTARDLKAGDIANWTGHGLTEGSVVFKKDHRYYRLRRTWNPNSLTLKVDKQDAKQITQEEAEELIGIDHSGFLAVVLMGQFNRFFFDLTPSEKLRIFSETLGLGQWITYSLKASGQAKDADIQLREAEKTESGLVAQITNYKSATTDNTIEPQLKQTTKQLIQVEKQWLKAKHLYQKIKPQFNEREEKQTSSQVVEANNQVRESERKLRRVEREFNDNEREIKFLKQSMDKLVSKEPGLCPTCGQELNQDSGKHIEEECIKLGKRLKELSKKQLIKTMELTDSQEAFQQSEQSLSDLINQLESVKKANLSIKSKIIQADKEQRILQHQTISLKEKQSDLSKRLQIEQERIHSLKRKRYDLNRHLFDLRIDIKFLRAAVSEGNYWAREFRNVRLWLIEESLKQLEIEVSNSLLELGLKDWKVKFDVERATKSGTISKGFTVLIQSPASLTPVKWESWCGGETQRLRLAGAVGLANLIRSRTTFDTNIEMWDEPTAHLSENGISDLLNFFEARAREQSKQIWLIDHRSLKAGNFDGEVSVKKTRNGSVICGSRIFHNVEQGAGIDSRAKIGQGWKWRRPGVKPRRDER